MSVEVMANCSVVVKLSCCSHFCYAFSISLVDFETIPEVRKTKVDESQILTKNGNCDIK